MTQDTDPIAIPPPHHLTDEAKRFWASVSGFFQLEPHEAKLLQSACEVWDRLQEARQLIAAEGMVQVDRFDQRKPHPAVGIERDCRAAFASALKQLGLDGRLMPLQMRAER